MLESGSTWVSFAVPVLVKVTAVLGATCALLLAARRASAARRHAIAALGLGASLLLPVLTLVLPRWEVGVLPAPSAATAATSSSRVAPVVTSERPAAASREETGHASSLPAVRPALLAAPPPAQPSSSAAARPFPWGLLVLLAWALGAELALLRLVAGVGGALALAERSRTLREASWRDLLASASARLGLSRDVSLRRGDVPVAMTTGVVNPVVLVPEDSTAWGEERRRVVLLHELAHVKRRDCLVQLVGEAAAAVFWFHPLAWVLVRRLRDLAEDAADDLVLASGERPSAYAGQLLDIVRELPVGAREPLPALAMGRAAGLEARLRAILDPARRRLGPSSRQLRATAAVLVAGAAALAALDPVSRTAEAAATNPERVSLLAPVSPAAVVAPLPARSVRARRAPRAVAVWSASPEPAEAPEAEADALPVVVAVAPRAAASPIALVGRRGRDGDRWYSRGMELHNDERYEDAIEAFKKAIDAGEREDAASYNIACGYARLGKKDDAFEWLKKARDAGFDLESYLEDDDDLRSLRSDPRWKALKESVRTSRSARREAKVRAKVERVDALLAETPRNGARLERAGRELLSSHEYEPAARALLAAAELGYRESTALYNAACALSLKGDTKAALDTLRRAVEAGYDDPHHMRQDDDLDPIRDDKGYREIERLAEDLEQPGDGMSWSRRLFPTTVRAHWREAAEKAREVAGKYPKLGRAWSNLGHAELRADRPDEARVAFEKALTLGYRKGATTYNIACAYARANQKDRAFEWLDKAVALGFDIGSYMRHDDDLDNLRSDARYRALEKQHRRSSRDDEDDD